MYKLKFQAPKNESAKYRIGSKVTCDYYPDVLFKVVAKEWDNHGNLFYTIQRTVGSDALDKFEPHCGLRQKHLNKA